MNDDKTRAALADELDKVRIDGLHPVFTDNELMLMAAALRSPSPYSGAAVCTICAGADSPGFYTGCLINDGHGSGEWQCDGKGNLTPTALPRDAAIVHASDCAVNNTPALPVGPCNCGATELARKSNFPALKVATVRPVSVQETLDIPAPHDAERETIERCPICDWTMAESREKGCVPGDCSYRPNDPAEQARIKRRRPALPSIEGSVQSTTEQADASRDHPVREAIKSHVYTPDYQAMGDCRVCGHGQNKPWHLYPPPPSPTSGKQK